YKELARRRHSDDSISRNRELRRVYGSWHVQLGHNGVRHRINDANNWGVLVVGKNSVAHRRNGNTLHNFGDGDDGDKGAVYEVEVADASSMDIGCISAVAVGRYDKHVRFDSACGDFRDNFSCFDVNDVEGLCQFCTYVKKPVRPEFCAVGTNGFAHGNAAGEFAFL